LAPDVLLPCCTENREPEQGQRDQRLHHLERNRARVIEERVLGEQVYPDPDEAAQAGFHAHRCTLSACSTRFPIASRAHWATCARGAASTRSRFPPRCARFGSRCSRPTSTSRS